MAALGAFHALISPDVVSRQKEERNTMNLGNLKALDERPPRGWWAPGGYISHCCKCKCNFIGDKRAGHCADCAYALPDPVEVGPPPTKDEQITHLEARVKELEGALRDVQPYLLPDFAPGHTRTSCGEIRAAVEAALKGEKE